MEQEFEFTPDEIYGERLLISTRADKTELNDNIRVARVLLHSFVDMYIRINEHLLIIGHKNPEYTINGKLGDRKGVESENGIKSAFRKAKLQGCKVVVLDFDMHMSESILKTRKIVSGLLGRHEDFSDGILSGSGDCPAIRMEIHRNRRNLFKETAEAKGYASRGRTCHTGMHRIPKDVACRG